MELTMTKNDAIERAELERWKNTPADAIGYYSFPAEAVRTVGYRSAFYPRLDSAAVTTWIGTVIGQITDARVYTGRLPMAGAEPVRIVAIKVKGTNGARYYGRASWDNGNVIRLRRAIGERS